MVGDAALSTCTGGCCGGQRFKRGPNPTSAFGAGTESEAEGEGSALAASGSGVGARARFIVEHAGWLATKCPQCEAVLGAFTALEGPALFELKRAVDGLRPGLHALVYGGACGAHAREVLLAHFRRSAERCGGGGGGGGGAGVGAAGTAASHTVVLCDIDDSKLRR
jgi:hypothetical protein